jgi:inner membrane protein
MMGHTHLVFGFLAGLLFLPVVEPQQKILFVGLATFASLWPDIDHEGSKINQILPVTRWFARFFTHRGFFHSVFPAVGLFVLFWYISLPEVGFALMIGYLSHLLTDSLTKMGVNLLHPFATLRVQGFLVTGGMSEYIVLALVVALAGWKLLS